MPSHHDIWRVLHDADAPISAAELSQLAVCGRGSVARRLTSWSRSGYLERQAGFPPTYILTAAGRAKPQSPILSRTRVEVPAREPAIAPVWRAMRVLSRHGQFDVPLLALTSNVAAGYVQNYVNRLRRAGYVRLIDARQNWRARPASFRLVRDTGPKAPRVDVRPGVRVLIDPNNGGRIDISPGRLSLRSKPSLAHADGGVS